MPRKFLFFLILGLGYILFCSCASGNKTLLIATTTSLDNTGLIDYLATKFRHATGIKLKWTAVGSGEALELGKNCDVSALLVHDPDAEKRFVKLGYGIERTPFAYNDFVILGPKSDPAHIRGLKAASAFKNIDKNRAVFISRGDNSGTNAKEQQLWQAININPLPQHSWYIQSGQGMLATINIATEKNGYTLADRGTYIKYQNNPNAKNVLAILSSGDRILRNQYSMLIINPKRCNNVKYNMAEQFKKWLVSSTAQNAINHYTISNKRLFIANA